MCVCVEVAGGRSQLEDETSMHITREGVSVWFTGKFQGSAMGLPVTGPGCGPGQTAGRGCLLPPGCCWPPEA